MGPGGRGGEGSRSVAFLFPGPVEGGAVRKCTAPQLNRSAFNSGAGKQGACWARAGSSRDRLAAQGQTDAAGSPQYTKAGWWGGGWGASPADAAK